MSASAVRRRLDTRRNRLLLVAASVAISALGTGLAAWWLWPSPPPPGLGSEFAFYDQWGRPISARTGALKLVLDPATVYANWPAQRDRGFTVDDNGFRATPRRPGRPRLVVLGGSAAFGWLLPSDQATFAWRLGERLPTHDVINAGVIGFPSGQELSLMVHRLDDPHVAAYVVFDGWNDLFDPVVEGVYNKRPLRALGFNNAFLHIQNRLWTLHRNEAGAGAERARLAVPRLTDIPEDEYIRMITDNYLRNIDRMHAFARGRNARFLVVLQPEIGSKPLPSAEERDILARWDIHKGYVQTKFPERYAAMRKTAGEFFRDRSIPWLDVSSAPEFREEREQLFIDTVHLNERGQRLVADLIERLADPR